MLLVSHCDFSGNSAYHAYAIATELRRRGWSPAIAAPGWPGGVRDLGRPDFKVLSYRDVRRGRLSFPDGAGPDLIHAFTPREHVRQLTLEVVSQFRSDYVVHLEDNEMAVSDAIKGTYDPAATRVFLDGAAGMTVIVDRLLEFKPPETPGAVVWPGYDPSLDEIARPRAAIRGILGLADSDVAIVYPGNAHAANAEEVHSLYEAVGRLRLRGLPIVLVRSGLSSVRLPKLGDGLRDLGWIRRRRVFELLHAADILVQPGVPGKFNDYRFPSKLPEFLASGRPVILPRSNVGLHVEDEVEAILLERGDAEEIDEKLDRLVGEPALRARIGRRGRDFARRRLRWSRNVAQLIPLYGGLMLDASGGPAKATKMD